MATVTFSAADDLLYAYLAGEIDHDAAQNLRIQLDDALLARTYYYDADGHMYQNQGVEIGGYWYYFDNDGIMKANFWRKKDGDRYYYDANGHLLTNRTMVINGVTYRFSSSGKVI